MIGHELTHGFDDRGANSTPMEICRDWWTKQDNEEFKKRVDCIANEYSQFSPVEGIKLNGQLTLGENGADNAGIRLAFMALLGGLEDGPSVKKSSMAYTPAAALLPWLRAGLVPEPAAGIPAQQRLARIRIRPANSG